MYKKLIFILYLLIFISCNKSFPDSKGEFNEIIIVSSLEDKQLLEPLINDYIFDYTIHTPEPEFMYVKNWITPEGFKYYREHSNIIIASISDPIDKSVDQLINDFKLTHNIQKFPVTISDVFSYPQMITLINESNDIISNASCTTNCAAPMIKVLDDFFTVESAYVTTVHSYTSDQNLHDGVHVDLRRARSAPTSIIPTSTGAAKALSCIFPGIKISGCGIRVPVSNCSLTDITCVIKNNTNIKEVNKLFEIASNTNLKNILHYNTDPIVSVDVKSSTYSCVFDSLLTYVSGNMVKIVGWYDNEYGYCSRLVDLLFKIS